MAIQHGTCGAWKSVQLMIERDAPHCQSPNDLTRIIKETAAARLTWAADAANDVRAEIVALRARIAEFEARAAALAESTRKAFAPAVEHVRQLIDEYERERLFPIRWYNQLFRLPMFRRRLTTLLDEPRRAVQPIHRAATEPVLSLKRLESNASAEIARRVQLKVHRLQRLQAAAASPEFVGATGELEMADLLVRGLPEDFHVFNDVHVELDKWVYADGKHHKSAQVDHLVVGPTGVFVVEHKLWSKSFAQRGQYHDPFEQVHWAAKLCHFMFKDRLGRKIKVREVLASRGHLPERPDGSFARVCRTHEVCGYVRWFAQELDRETVNAIRKILSPLD